MTEELIAKAYLHWSSRNELRKFDKRWDDANGTLNLDLEAHRDWLSHNRRGLSLSCEDVARKMGVSKATYRGFETREQEGRLTLQNINDAAQAMDCEFIYLIRPKNRKTYSQVVWESFLPEALQDSWLKNCDQNKLPQALSAVVSRYVAKPHLRKRLAEKKAKRDPSPTSEV